MTGKPGFKAGYVAIVGLPNVGKSTLLNRLVRLQVSIVAPRPQTTRHRILGILNGEGYQALFLDTPGLLKPAYKLQELMEKEVERALDDADVLLLLLDATGPESGQGLQLPPQIAEIVRARSGGERNPQITQITQIGGGEESVKSAESADEKSGPCPESAGLVVAVNKVDKVDKDKLLPLVAQLQGLGFGRVFTVSALNGFGVEELKQELVSALPEGEPFYPPDMVSERPERFFCAEFVREAIFNRYGAEVPYATAVVIDEFAERPGRKDYIKATIYVERGSQKAILIGREGEALKKVGSIARGNIERFLGRPVYLELWVKVAEAWRKNETFIRQNVYPR